MELIGGLIGAGLVAVAPMVPGLRPVAKALVKGGMAVAQVTVVVAATVTEQVSDLLAQTRAQPESETILESTAAPVTEATTAAAEAPAAEVPPAETTAPDLPAGQAAAGAAAAAAAGVRPLAKATVKGGMVLADAAKGAVGAAVSAVAAAGQQLGDFATSLSREKHAASAAVGHEDAAAGPAVVADSAVTAEASSDAPAVAQAAAEAATAEAASSSPELEPAPSQPATAAPAAPPAPDDLLRIKGVGPKTAGLLQAAGITTFAQLAATPVDQLQAILQQAGGRYRIIDPASWPAQAQALLAAPAPDEGRINPI